MRMRMTLSRRCKVAPSRCCSLLAAAAAAEAEAEDEAEGEVVLKPVVVVVLLLCVVLWRGVTGGIAEGHRFREFVVRSKTW